MSRPIVSVSEETDAGEVADVPDSNRIKCVPVLDNGNLVGLVTRSDLVRALAWRSPVSRSRGAATGPYRRP